MGINLTNRHESGMKDSTLPRMIRKRVFTGFVAFIFLQYAVMSPAPVFAGDLPAGPDVQVGAPTITTTGPDMVVNANSHDKTWIDWGGGFNIGAENSVSNIGPSSSAVMLHNDVSGMVSNIQGMLNGNCNVFLLNANGVLFSPTAQVNVAGLVASSLMMDKDDFRNGNYLLGKEVGSELASVINQGGINSFGPGGVTLAGGAVSNSGVINADLGRVNMVAGEQVTLNISGNGSIVAAVTEEALSNVYDQNGDKVNIGASNVGTITAEGNEVYIEVEAAQEIFDTLINNEGIVSAGSMVERDGKIMLVSDSDGIIENFGLLDVSAIEAGADGGDIIMSGEKVGQFGEIHADGIGTGDGGNVDIIASGTAALSSTEITESIITADGGVDGDGGQVIAFSPDTMLFRSSATVSVRGGENSGDGGYVEISGQEYVEVDGIVDRRAANGESGTLYIDPTDLTIDDAGVNNTLWTGDAWADNGNRNTSQIDIDTLEAHLDNGHTSLDATAGGGGGAGNITFDAGRVLNNGAASGSNNNLTLTGAAVTFTTGITFTGTGDLSVVASGDVDVNSALTLADDVTISSGGDIETSASGSINCDALSLTTTTAGDTIGTVTGTDPLISAPLYINATTVTASSQQGHIIIKDTAGGIGVNSISTNDVKDADDATRIILTAVGGAITGVGAGTEIDAWAANLVTMENADGSIYGGAIGTTGTPIVTDVTVLNATADNGGVFISQGAVDMLLGDITARYQGATPWKNDDGLIVINTENDTSTYDIEINAGADVIMSGAVQAPDKVTIVAADGIADSNEGNDFLAETLTLTADVNADASIGIGQSANHIDIIAGTVNATSGKNGVYLTESIGVTVGTIASSGASNNVEVTASTGNLKLGGITAAGAVVTLESTQGTITDNNAAADNVISESVVFTADDGIGAGDAIETKMTGDAADLSITATVTEEDGIINIDEFTGALAALTVETNSGEVTIGYGAKTLDFGATEILALDDAALTTLDFENTGGGLKLNGVTVGTTATLEASTAITQTGNKLTATTATLTAGTNIGAAGAGRIQTNVDTLTAAASDGGVYVLEDDGLNLTASAAGTTKDIVAVATAGDMTINAVTATQAVNLTAAGSILDGNTTTNNISGTETTLVATAGAIGASGDTMDSTVVGAITATAATGLYMTNVGNVSGLTATVTNAAAADLDIAFTNTGTTKLVALSAEDSINLTSSDVVTGTDGGVNDITTAALTVSARQFGAAGAANWIETNVDTYTSIVTTNGGIFIDDTAGAVAVTALTAGGSGADVYFKSAGSLALSAITATGDDVVVDVTGNITDDNAGTTNVTADTLDITASGTIGAGDPLELSINQIQGTNTSIAVVNEGAMSVTANTLAGSNIDITADEITIFDNGGGTTAIGGGTLKMTASYGDIVFLDATDTITAAGAIEFYALYDGDPSGVARIDNVTPGRIVAGNLTSTGGGDITLAAYSDITVGHLNAGAGTVNVYAATSAFNPATRAHTAATHGLILDGNAGTTNITAGSAYVYAKMHTSLAAELEREGAIADYAARVAEANAKSADVDNLTTLTSGYETLSNTALAVKNTAQSTYDSDSSDYDTEEGLLNTYDTAMTVLVAVRSAAQIVKDIASFPSSGAQAIPLSGDGGASVAGAVVDLVFSIADAAMVVYERGFIMPQEDVVQEAQSALDVSTANLESATNDYNDARDEHLLFNDTLDIATTVQTAANTARDHSQVIRTQALSSDSAVDAIGSDAFTGATGSLEINAATVSVVTEGAVTTGAAATVLSNAKTVTLNTVGDIDMTNNNTTVGDATVTLTTDEDISYTQTGGRAVIVSEISTTDTTNGIITIVADGEIYSHNGDAGTADISAPTINLTTTAGGIGTTEELEINATTALNVTTSNHNGNVTIEDVTGNFPIGAIASGGGTVLLTSAGIILDATTDTTNDITAASLGMTAANGVGETASLETTVSTLAATTGIGDINVTNSGALAIGTVGAVNGATITTAGNLGNNIFILASSPLTVNVAVSDAGGGDIRLVADGTADTDDMAINAAITASGGTGDIDLYAGDTITQGAFAVTAAGSGDITYYAGVDYNGGTPQAGLATGLSDITMNAAATAVSGSGDITMTAPKDVTLGSLSTTGNVAVTADDSTYITSNSDGDIMEAAAEGTANIIAATATLRAATGIGAGGTGDDIETNITTLDAVNSTSGNIDIYEIAGGTDLNINQAAQTAAGDITVQTQNGFLTVAADQSGVTAGGTGAVTLIAGDTGGNTEDLTVNDTVTATTGKVTLTSSGDDVIFGAGGDVTTTSGEVEVNATSDAGNGAITMVDGTVINAGDDIIDLNADVNIAIGSLSTTNSSAAAVTIDSAEGALTDAGDTDVDIVANSGRVVINTITGVGSADDIETTISSLDIDNTTSGNILIDETDAITVVKAVQATTGNISVVADGTITADSAGAPANVISTLLTGTIALDANGTTSGIVVNDGISSATGNITLTADNDVTFAAEGDITSTSGNVSVTADADSVDDGASGSLTMNDGTLINPGSGTIAINADEDITLGGLLTTNATGSAVAVTSTSGAVVDGGDTYTDIDADAVGAVTTIDAVTGVGSANALETEVATIDIDNTPDAGANATGNIQIVEQDTADGGLIIQKAVQGDVGVDAKNTGTINISTTDGLINITGPVTARDGGTISIDANDAGGNEDFSLTVGGLVTSSVGLKDRGVDVVYAGAIALSADDDVDVNAKVSTSNANSSYTANADISVTADTGDVLIGEEVETVGEGSIIVLAAQNVDFDAAGGLLDTTETTAGADVTVTATAGNITESVNNADLDIQANTVNLNATAGNAYIRGHGAGENLEIDSVLAVNADTSGGTGEITLSELTGNMLVGLIDGGTGTVTLTAASGVEEEATGDAAADIVGDTLNLTATSGGIGSTAAIEINSITKVDADSSVANGNINLNETTGALNLGLITAGTGDVTLTSTDNAILDADLDAGADIIGSAATLRAVTGVGTSAANADIDTTITTLDVVNATSGDIYVYEVAAGTDLAINQAAQTTAGNINVQTQNGNLTVADSQSGVTAVGAGTVTLIAGDSDTGYTEDLAINDTVTSVSGLITLTSTGDDVTFGSGGDVTTTSGTVDVNAESGAGLGEGKITMTDGAVINSGTAQTTMDAYGDITMGGVTTTYAADDAVWIASAAGGIVDGGDTDVDIVANTATATADLDAVTGIGSANALETSIYNFEATNTTSGDIRIAETDAINLVEVINSGGGQVDVTTPGTIVTTNITANNSGAVNLNSTGGNIISNGGVITATANSTLRAGGTIGTKDNIVVVSIDGELGVAASGRDGEISAHIAGRVSNAAKTERVEVIGTSSGLIVFNNHLMSGDNYGSGSSLGSMLGSGYGGNIADMGGMTGSYHNAASLLGDQIKYSGMASGISVVNDNYLNGPAGIIDGDAIGMDILPLQAIIQQPRLEMRPPRFNMNNYYVIRKQGGAK